MMNPMTEELVKPVQQFDKKYHGPTILLLVLSICYSQ